MDRSSEGELAPPSSHERGGFIRNVLPALLWGTAIFIGGGGGMPQADGESFGIPSDKLLHAVAFLGLQALCFRALRYELAERSRRQLLVLAAGLSIVFGITLEIYQLGLPDRSAEVGDAVADAIGAVLGAVLLSRVPWG